MRSLSFTSVNGNMEYEVYVYCLRNIGGELQMDKILFNNKTEANEWISADKTIEIAEIIVESKDF